MSEFEIEFTDHFHENKVPPLTEIHMKVKQREKVGRGKVTRELPRHFFRWHVVDPDNSIERYDNPENVQTFTWHTPDVNHAFYRFFCELVLISEADRPPLELADLTNGRVNSVAGPVQIEVERVPVYVTPLRPLDGAAEQPDSAVPVSLQRTAITATESQLLWSIIRNRTDAIGFNRYQKYMNRVFSSGGVDSRGRPKNGDLAFRGPAAYELMVVATEAFLMHEVGVVPPHVPPEQVGDASLGQVTAAAAIDQLRYDAEWANAEAHRLGGGNVLAHHLQQLRQSYYEKVKDEQGHDVLVLPYLNIIRERLSELPVKTTPEVAANGEFYGVLKSRISGPLAIELIWTYWHEEGMLAQTLNTIMARFENRRAGNGKPDPLARMELDPIRPLNNLLWGWVQNEIHRTTVRRRAFEYAHEYGLKLIGKAIPESSVVDERSKFLESFHNLLHLTHVFFKEDDDTTVIADGFPMLNALRETHLLLAEGAHNQFGDLPSATRAEMLVMEWLLARPEMREFLGGRIMVPYEEEWMDRVDIMKGLQGWTDTPVTHFRDLGVFGEQILLGVRYGNWTRLNDPQEAANWARYWRPEIQRYVHAYRAVTGVDLTESVNTAMPSELLARRNGGGVARRVRIG